MLSCTTLPVIEIKALSPCTQGHHEHTAFSSTKPPRSELGERGRRYEASKAKINFEVTKRNSFLHPPPKKKS